MVGKSHFGSTRDGREVSLYTLVAKGIEVRVTDFGACTVGILVPDARGVVADVIPGFDSADGYLDNPSFFGATVGPSCNRIAGAAIEIDGVTWHLAANEGTNNLHTDIDHGLHKRLWDAETTEGSVTMHTHLSDGELGLPGERDFSARFEVVDGGIFRLTYHASSDRTTFVNMTDHLYLNLRGHDSGLILDQLLTLHAHRFTPVAKGSIPTGELREVTGTPFDFTVGKAIGTDLEDDCEQLGLTGGFDHNFCIDGYTGDGSLLNAAHVSDPVSGRMLDVSTTQPGIQFYAGNYVGDAHAKDGVDYGPRSSFALETQFFPDTPHHDGFPQAFFGPGHDYEATTIYSFSAR